jgi:multidrug efflux pump subunit AcrB
MALVGLVIFLVMRWRTSLIVMLAIPISFVIALGFVQALGYGLQQMTIVALVIALGLLVDNAIVVTENINRFLRQGKDPLSAVAEATSQVGWAVASATLTTVLAFLPIVLMKDVSGDFIRSMPVTVMITLISSLLVALTLTPLLSYWLLRPTSAATRITRLVNYLLEHQYRASLNWALGHRKTVLAIATMAFFGSLALFPLVGVSFFPKAEKPQFVVNVRLPKGSSLEATDAVTRQVESVLLAQPEVKSVATNVGKGNPLIYYNVQRENEKTNYAQLFVQLQKQNSGRRTEELVAALRRQFSEYPGAKIEAKEFEQGPPVEAPVLVRVRGDDLPALTRLASQVERILNEIPGTVNVDNPLATQATDLQIDINKDKAALLGVPLAEIDRTVRIAMAGFAASIYRDDEGESYPIVVRLPAAPVWAEPRRAEQTDAANGTNGVSGKTSYESLSQIYVASVTGAQIPLAQLAKFRFRAGYGVIMHWDLSRMVSVTSDVNGRTAAEVSADLEAALKQLRLPPGFSVQIGGESESRGESFTSLYQATVIALVAILGVLVLQFRSFAQPLIIFSTIPLGVIGVILGLLFSGNSFSFSAFVGLTSLVGIVVNNSILLVEYANQLRAEGHSVSEAIRQAAATRFLPILLTTGTTVGGLLPLTLGGGTLWAPMGWAIIGGLAVSTFLTLLVTPVLYEMLTKRT